MKIEKDENIEIGNSDLVVVKKMGNVVEIRKSNFTNSDMPFIKISDKEYIVKDSGEVKEFNKSENKSENLESLRQTFKRLRDLINTNFVGAKNELFITLTYAENMTDTKQLCCDFEKFNKKMKYKYDDIDYINVVEPQARGAWHCHVLYRFNSLESVFIKNSDISKMWGHGFVTVRALEECDNIGSYLSAYLADIDLNDTSLFDGPVNFDNLNGKKVFEKEVDGETKRFVKGGRLHLYPSKMQLYRVSKGIIKPTLDYCRYSDIKKIVGSTKPHYQKNIVILDDNFKKINRHQYVQYNLKR